MIHDLPAGTAIDATQAEAIIRQLEAAFAPHRCWVALREDHCLDFEVMTLDGDPVAAFSPYPIEWLVQPEALAEVIHAAKQVGQEHGHAFEQPIQRP